jgi:hypothetical protein
VRVCTWSRQPRVCACVLPMARGDTDSCLQPAATPGCQ